MVPAAVSEVLSLPLRGLGRAGHDTVEKSTDTSIIYMADHTLQCTHKDVHTIASYNNKYGLRLLVYCIKDNSRIHEYARCNNGSRH